jgi:hypothetical protein
MSPGDFDERVPKMMTITQELVKDGRLEGVEMKLDEIRGLEVAYLSATASAVADEVYDVPAGKVVITKDLTLTNMSAAPALIDIFDGADQLDAIIIAANDSVVLGRSYRFEDSIVCYCSVWLAQTSYSFSYYEYPLTNRATVPP